MMKDKDKYIHIKYKYIYIFIYIRDKIRKYKGFKDASTSKLEIFSLSYLW